MTTAIDARIQGVGPTRELLIFDTLLEAFRGEAIDVLEVVESLGGSLAIQSDDDGTRVVFEMPRGERGGIKESSI